MRSLLSVVFGLLCLGSPLVAGLNHTNSSGGGCGFETLEVCLSPLFVDFSVVNITAESLNNSCSLVPSAEKCMTDAGCSEKDKYVWAVWLGVKDGLTYLCGEAKQGFVEYCECLQGPKVLEALSHCNSTFSEGVKSKPEDFCKYGNQYLSCNKQASKSCGQKASEILLTYTYKALEPSAKALGCTLDTKYAPIGPKP